MAINATITSEYTNFINNITGKILKTDLWGKKIRSGDSVILEDGTECEIIILYDEYTILVKDKE